MTRRTKLVIAIAAPLLGIAVVAGVIGNLTGATRTPSSEPTPSQVQTSPPAPSLEATPVNDLAARVETALQTELGVENFTDLTGSASPLYAIASIEDMYAGTIRVNYQETLTDEGRDEVARHVFNLTAPTVDDLDTIVIRDTSGRDSNHYRR